MELWPFIPQREFTESLEWLTDVIRCKASEQRFALRKTPRHGYQYNLIMEPQQFSRAKLMARALSQGEVSLPLWGELTYVGPISMGATSISFNTWFAHYKVGGQVVVWQDDDHFELRTINSLSPSGVGFSIPLDKSYSDAVVAPVRPVTFAQEFEASRSATDLVKAQARFLAIEAEDLTEVGAVQLGLTNASAEAGNTSGWTIVSGAWVARNDVGISPSGGFHFFPGASASAKMYQTVQPVSQGLSASRIDAGTAKLTLLWEQGTFLGGTPYDDGQINVRFKTSGGTLISSVSTGYYAPTTATEPNYAWETLSSEMAIPANTRRIEIELEARRNQGTNNDALFDNIRVGIKTDYVTYKDHDVMTDRTFIVSDIRERFEREVEVVDNGTGVIWQGPQFTYPVQTSMMAWETLTREELWYIRVWLHSRRGKWKGFWLPSWNNDLQITQPIADTDTEITISAIGYPSFEGQRDIMILTKAGSMHFARVLNGDDGLLSQEVLTLEAPIGFNLAVSDIEMVCFMTFMRFDADRIEIKHKAARGASIAVAVMEAPIP